MTITRLAFPTAQKKCIYEDIPETNKINKIDITKIVYHILCNGFHQSDGIAILQQCVLYIQLERRKRYIYEC